MITKNVISNLIFVFLLLCTFACQNTTPEKKLATVEKETVKEKETAPTLPTEKEEKTTKFCLDKFELHAHLVQHSAALDAMKIPYSQANGTDCSGMFHKMLDSFKEQCPNSAFPNMQNARSSRNIAQWYHDNGNLTIIKDPVASGQLIKPGAVMFYGYQDQTDKLDRDALSMEILATQGKGVNHVAIVTEVTEKDGAVKSYKIFHGRNPKYTAGVTECWLERNNFPTYGNGPEPWLGIVPSVLVMEKEVIAKLE